jgi:hypothetical protein
MKFFCLQSNVVFTSSADKQIKHIIFTIFLRSRDSGNVSRESFQSLKIVLLCEPFTEPYAALVSVLSFIIIMRYVYFVFITC